MKDIYNFPNCDLSPYLLPSSPHLFSSMNQQVCVQCGAGARSHYCSKCELQPVGSLGHYSSQRQDPGFLGRNCSLGELSVIFSLHSA